MVAPVKINFKIYQGSTFKQVLRWESSTKVYAPITNITKSAPVVITVPNHNVPLGWRTKITNVGGMKEINSDSVYHVVTEITDNTVAINQLNTLGYSTYTSGGILEYNQPVDILGISARMQLREKITSDTVIHELSTDAGTILVDNVDRTITLIIPAETTQTFTFSTCVYSLEIVEMTGDVITFATGTMTLQPEVTR